MIFRDCVAQAKLVEQLSLVTLQTTHHEPTSPRFAPIQRNHGRSPVSTDFCNMGNSGIESDTGRGNQLSRTNVPASCGLAIMESSDEELRWTGRVVEADIDLCGG